ncbi:hypothetical protein D2544_026 [Lactococcus phage D2544]|nr:hypothetical protein D2544_024 [Lactococcus phage D2544]UXD81225.1 hypothetical protein D2544_026 [Lactococcus phage D2544]
MTGLSMDRFLLWKEKYKLEYQLLESRGYGIRTTCGATRGQTQAA